MRQSRKSIFLKIDKTIREERLYTDYALMRENITSRFGISRITLGHLLKLYANGKTFPSYINSIRLENVCQLLTTTNDSISDIAEKVGLMQHNLHRIFKAQYGLTPKQYRESKLPASSKSKQ